MALLPGQILDGKYRVVRLIGEGGMGAVYEGANERIGRRVAIKVMHAEAIANADLFRRFQREAQAAARIGSTHIVDVLDLGDLPNGESYMVMEYLEGESLAQRIQTAARLSVRDAALIAHQLLEGLGAMHTVGIIHRDLKPANVFLAKTSKGEVVKILDFGVSKFKGTEDEPELATKSGAVMGTPHYMSPEQARGNNKEIDARTDLYALGVILYRCVSGQLPFDGENFHELLFKIALEEPPPLASIVPDVDPAFAQIVMRAMARDPAARYGSADELRTAIEAWGRSQGQPSLQFEKTLRASSGRLIPASAPAVSATSEVERLRAAVEGKNTPTAWSEGNGQKGGTLVAGPRADARSAPRTAAPVPDRKSPRPLVFAVGGVLGVILLAGVGLALKNRHAPAAIPSSAPVATETPPLPPPPPSADPSDPQLPPVSPLATTSAAPSASPPPPPIAPPPHPTGKPAPVPAPPTPAIASVASAAPSATTAPTTAPVGSVHGRKIRTDL